MAKPSADDRAREALTEQFGRKEPVEAKQEYSEKEWSDTFERRWVLPNAKYLSRSTEVAGSGGHAYCRLCVIDKKHGKVAAYRLHITIEEDVMKVAKHGLIHAVCHGCGFDMFVPRTPKMRRAIYDEADKFPNIDHAAMQQMIDEAIKYQAKTQAQRQAVVSQEEANRRAFMEAYHKQIEDKLKRIQASRAAQMAVGPPLIMREKLDPDKWPTEP